MVDHGDHGKSLYAHLSEVLVGGGQWVDQNTMIGRVGSSGGGDTPIFTTRSPRASDLAPLDPAIRAQ